MKRPISLDQKKGRETPRGCWEEEGHGLEGQGKHCREQSSHLLRGKMASGQQEPSRGCAETLAELREPARLWWSSIEPSCGPPGHVTLPSDCQARAVVLSPPWFIVPMMLLW